MANKKISELDSRASLSLSDLLAVGDPTTGYLYKITITDLKSLTGAGVISFNGRVGAVSPAEGDYTLTQLGDVIITSPSNGQYLQYNGSNWVNATLDLSGYVTLAGSQTITGTKIFAPAHSNGTNAIVIGGFAASQIKATYGANVNDMTFSVGDGFSVVRLGTAAPAMYAGLGMNFYGNYLAVYGTHNGTGNPPGEIRLAGNYGLGTAAIGAYNTAASSLIIGNSYNSYQFGQIVYARNTVWMQNDASTQPSYSAAAIMNLQSTTKGFVMPRMTTAQRDAIASPITGLEVYNSSTNKKNYYNGSTWIELTVSGDLSSYLTGNGTAGNIPFYTGTTTLGNENGFMYDSSTNRFGVNTTVPNATIGANAAIDSGYSLLLKNADANYNGLGFGIDSTYGNLITTQKFGTALARNFTLQNQAGYISIDETGNLGVNILTPKGGLDVYQSTNSYIYLHTSTSGVLGTDGVRLALFSTGNANLRNFEAGTFSITSESDFYIITNGAENFRVNASDGSIYQSKVANAMLKTVSGVLTAAVAGTDYLAPSALSSYVPTSRNLTINGVTYDLAGDRSWTVGTTTGSGASGQVTYWNGTTSMAGSNNHYWDATNNRLGIGLTNPQRSVEIYSATADSHLRLSGSAPSVSMGEAVTGSVYQAKFGLATALNHFVTGSVPGDFVILNQTGNTIWAYNSAERMRLDTNGNVGIGGIANSSYRLHVFGTAPMLGIESTTTGSVYLRMLQAGTVVSSMYYNNSNSNLVISNNNGGITFNTLSVNSAVSITSDGNVAIGATSNLSRKLVVNGSFSVANGWGTSGATLDIDADATGSNGVSFSVSYWGAGPYGPMIFKTGNTERMRVTSSGVIALNGSSSPSSGGIDKMSLGFQDGVDGWIQTWGGRPLSLNSQGNNVLIGTRTDAGTGALQVSGTISAKGGGFNLRSYNTSGTLVGGFYVTGGGSGQIYLYNSAGGTEKIGLDGDSGGGYFAGNILVGMTSVSTTATGSMISNGGTYANLRLFGTGTQTFAQFFLGGTAMGSITGSGSTTSYNTSSDYRLKEDLKSFSGLDIVSSLKMYDFKWKSDGSRMYGVIAHELQGVLPYAVVGEKDGKYMQGVDYSKLTPINTKAIQELYIIIQEQQAQIESLKAKLN
jgi:Chaperone of endosialidase